MTLPESSVSDRGFRRQKPILTDYGHVVRVYESSAAKGPCLWLAVELSELGAQQSGFIPQEAHAHLTLDQARAVRDALTAAIEDHYQCR